MGCRRSAVPGALLRVARAPHGGLGLGPGPGRGAWLCRDRPECLERALRNGALSRALRSVVDAADAQAVRDGMRGAVPSGEGTPQVCEDGGSGRGVGRPAHEEEGP
ncbi:MAG TPA: DUF448 domain-containing protein [Acidimicrobiales bacterium]|nr:DUF448 domain-containing protein [Acidimicrobiales bacterium]